MMKDEEKALKLRPLSIGSMELMQRFNCGFMDGSMNLGCIVEYIYIQMVKTILLLYQKH